MTATNPIAPIDLNHALELAKAKRSATTEADTAVLPDKIDRAVGILISAFSAKLTAMLRPQAECGLPWAFVHTELWTWDFRHTETWEFGTQRERAYELIQEKFLEAARKRACEADVKPYELQSLTASYLDPLKTKLVVSAHMSVPKAGGDAYGA